MCPAYAPEFSYTFSGSGTGRIETGKGLRWLEQSSREPNMVTYPIQIVNKPYCVILRKVSRPPFIPLSMKYLVQLVAEMGRRSVEG